MEILNLNVNDNLKDWKILRTSKLKTLALKDRSIDYEVHQIPVDILVYNANNGRMFLEAKRFENEENIKLESLKISDPKKYNDEVENLIWSTNEERNLSTKRDIEKYGQMEPGVVLDDGTVIDGNRRFTCIRRLHREHPEDPKFNYFLAAIVRVDGEQITSRLLKEYELRVQFGADEKVGYNVINKNMSIYELIEKNEDFDYTTVAELLGNNTTPGEVAKICRTCKLVDEFLQYIKKTGEYQIAEDMKVYWPLEALGTYLSNDGRKLSPLEKNQRKSLFFDYLLTLDVSLITQNLRDELIKKVFKSNELTKELISEHKRIIGNQIRTIIDESNTVKDFSDLILQLKASDAAKEDKEKYEEAIGQTDDGKLPDLALKQCKNALKSLDNVNVKPLVETFNTIAEKKLNEISDYLNDIIIRVEQIKLEMNKKNEK